MAGNVEVEIDDTPMSGGERMVASGATMMRIEQDSMIAVSVQRPRDEAKILGAAMKELDMVPSLAERAYYSMEFQDRVKGGVNIVTGPSVRAARSLARRWGNCSCRAVITDEDPEKVYLTGIFVDLETNVRFERPLTVSKHQNRRDGKRYTLSDEKLIQAIQAGASKAERNAILAGLPDYLVASYDAHARSIVAREARSDGNLTSRVINSFLEVGVTREMLERRLGHTVDKLSDEEVVTLRGLLSALQDRETTVEDAFPVETAAPATAPTPSVSDVLAAGAEVTGGAVKSALQAATPATPAAPVASPRPTPPAAPAPSPAKRVVRGRVVDIDGPEVDPNDDPSKGEPV